MMSWINENTLYFENRSDSFISILMNIWYAIEVEELDIDSLHFILRLVYHLAEIIVKFQVEDAQYNFSTICR